MRKKCWKLKYARLLLLLLLFSSPAFHLENDYFFPIKPGQQNYLSGSLGELRFAHFHAGIDIKTDGVEGLPVYASANGYVSRIKVEGGGYGNALYIAHPNLGTTTVYGHLQRFEADIASFVRREQYRRKQFSVDLYLSPGQFQVVRGERIGYSGNSGSSGGPHLHFEIRDSDQRPLNPLKYNFPEVVDNIPPVVERIAIKTLDSRSRVNGQFGVFEFTPIRTGSRYTLPGVLEVYGNLGIMVQAHDRMNGSPNRCGVNRIRMRQDGKEIIDIELDRIPFNLNRHILVYRDYELFKTGNRSFQKLYREPGNRLDIYRNIVREGKILIADSADRRLEIELEDSYGNTSSVLLQLTGKPAKSGEKIQQAGVQVQRQQVLDHTLRIMGSAGAGSQTSTVFLRGEKIELPPAYYVNQYAVYLWDLRQGIPDSVDISGQMVYPQVGMKVPPGVRFSYFTPRIELYFDRNSLFDTLQIKSEYIDELEKDREYFEISKDVYPLKANISVLLKPQKTYRAKSKTSVYSTTNHSNFSWAGGEWRGDAIEFKTRTLGTYTLLTDSLAPQVRILQQNREYFSCNVTDNLSGVRDVHLHIGGAWVLLVADPKNNHYRAEKEDYTLPFIGDVELIVRDRVNNEYVYRSKIN